jgi:hypothetical protein
VGRRFESFRARQHKLINIDEVFLQLMVLLVSGLLKHSKITF